MNPIDDPARLLLIAPFMAILAALWSYTLWHIVRALLGKD